MKESIALVDCNNFFVSCERVFRPDVEGRPAVVLSSNDGCIIARSEEAKALGIKMGEPYFMARDIIDRHNVQVFSGNHALYGDISRRVDEVLEMFSPRVENYSIDESFLDFTGIRTPILHAHDLRRTVRQWTGIPTCVGIAPTKTLAKLANRCAKKMPVWNGVCDLSAEPLRSDMMARTDVADIWGIGQASAEKLYRAGIRDALALAKASPRLVRDLMNVPGARLQDELNGIPCFGIDVFPSAKKGIAVTRSFGERVTELDDLKEAVADFTTRAAAKLRGEGQETKTLTVFIRTGRHGQAQAYYSNAMTFAFPAATDDSIGMTRAALAMLGQLYRPGYKYAKAGVYLGDLSEKGMTTQDLLTWGVKKTSDKVMEALDRVNRAFGQGALKPARLAAVQQSAWQPKSARRSQGYTTRWGDFLAVR